MQPHGIGNPAPTPRRPIDPGPFVGLLFGASEMVVRGPDYCLTCFYPGIIQPRDGTWRRHSPLSASLSAPSLRRDLQLS